MKTKYTIVISILILSILTVVFYAYRWSNIHNETDKFNNIKHLTVELKFINYVQKTKLKTLLKQYNYDEITSLNKQLDDFINIYLKTLYEINDKTLHSISNKIKTKNEALKFSYEDYKTDNAEIKNSIKWLSKNLKHYLENPSFYGDNKEIVQKIFTILIDGYVAKKDDFKYTKVSNNKSINNINNHLQVLYVEYDHLLHAKDELDNYNINLELEEVYLYTNLKLKELREEVDIIGGALFLSVVFLIIFGLIIYYKEVSLSNKVAKLKNELQQFVDALNESAIISKTDPEGKITYVNEMFCNMSGYSYEELIGHSHNIVRHPETPKELFKELWQTIQSKKIFRGLIKNLKKDGGFYYVDVVIIPLLDIDSNISEYLAVRYNVTELIESRDRAIKAEKSKGEFLSNMSHELRTPLNSINGFASILQRTVKDDKHLAYLQNIKDSSDHLIGLINDILDLSKLQSGKFSIDYHNFDFYEKINLLIKRFDAQFINAELKLKLDLDSNTKIILKGDWLRISQIITNLISNAIKFTPATKEISLSASYENNILKITVKDSGIGMSDETQKKIFKPFEQADSSTTRKYGGTGLGLSIVSNLIEQMKGEIKLDSQEGIGSTFSVFIPLEQVEITQDKIMEEEIDIHEKSEAHILIAEDNKTNQMLIGILVEELGLTYKIANDGNEAVAMFGEEEFDLVLMDENMPNLNGIQAMQKIHSLYGNSVPIVALTANAMHEDEERFLEAGMSGYIPKPIDNDVLYKVIKTLLNKK